ncbi:MAG: hypothetical protein Q9M11_05395, partial [Mariprofundaceae bacterium]|nr:hypothetical protein [Mariprofundaceae bacterium]
ERRLDKRRKQGIENVQIQHNMKMDEMQRRNNILLENQKAASIKEPEVHSVASTKNESDPDSK